MSTPPYVPHAYRARWVFPVEGAPLENGTVEVQEGRIVAVHCRHDPAAQDLGNVAIIPGLVNAHTHLEFSDLAAPISPAAPFTAWLRALVAWRRETASGGALSRVEDRVSHGRQECALAGVTTIGDIVTAGWTAAAVSSSGPRIVAFFEALGLRPDQKEGQLSLARRHLEQPFATAERQMSKPRHPVADAPGSPDLVRGLSPHAPYSVHPDLFDALVDLAAEFRAPLAIHLAETRAELELLATGSGEFVDFLRELGVWQANAIPHGSQPLDFLRPLAKLDRALVIHGNYLAADELEFMAKHENIAVVYCPRTHAYFQHAPHPWREMLSRGIRVALGTDSRASNPDLSLWNELLFLRERHPDFDPALLLRLGTLNGAEALGLAAESGSLAPGKSADLAVVSFTAGGSCDPYALLFDPRSRVTATMCRGQCQ